jgi:hypothetical protein
LRRFAAWGRSTKLPRSSGCIRRKWGQWKRELREQAAGLFEVKRGVRPADPSASPDRLYSEIGRLKMDLDWLKKKSGISP